jgi:hypothetical protein
MGLVLLPLMLPLVVVLSSPLLLALSGLFVAYVVKTRTLNPCRKRVSKPVVATCFALLVLASLAGESVFATCVVIGANQSEPAGNHFWASNPYCRTSPLRHLYLQ